MTLDAEGDPMIQKTSRTVDQAGTYYKSPFYDRDRLNDHEGC